MAGKPQTSHLERTEQEPRAQDIKLVTIRAIEQINSDIRILTLRLEGPVRHRAGQWLDVFIPGCERVGGFTITSPPSAALQTREPYLELAIQSAPDGPAAWLWWPQADILGQTLRVRVGGRFVYPPAEHPLETTRRVVLIGGGVGVNPLVSMLGDMAERGDQVQVDVLYGSKLPSVGVEGVAFLRRMADAFAEGRVRGSLQLFLTNAKNADVNGTRCTWLEHASVSVTCGRMTKETVLSTIRQSPKEQTVVYICGPPQMTDDFAEAASSLYQGAIDKARVMTEKWW